MLSSSSPPPSAVATASGPCHPSPQHQAMRGSSDQIFVQDGHALLPPEPADSTSQPRRAPPTSPTPPHAPLQATPSASPTRPALRQLQEYHSGFSDVDIGPAPSRQPASHRRQQSFPVFFSRVFPRREPSSSVARHSSSLSEDMPLTGDGRPGRSDAPRAAGGGLAGWLGGGGGGGGIKTDAQGAPSTSATDDGVQEGVLERTDPDTTPTALRRSQTRPGDVTTPKITVTSTASKFMSAITRFTQAPVSPTVDDELYNLDVEAALFPSGPPSDRDTFSPAAFKNLQLNATGLLSKMQTAYRQRVVAYRDLEGEKAAQQDELEEAETRGAHLKMQLEGMAHKAAEQEKAMEQLMEQLAAEKKARSEERLARQKRLVLSAPEGSMVAEDLGVVDDRVRRAWRKSGETVKTDTSYETDEESAESESVFSRSRSPTIPPSTVDGSVMDAVPPSSHAKGAGNNSGNSGGGSNNGAMAKAKPAGQQMSAFQRIIKGISGEVDENGASSCRNCKGRDASVAWDTVSLLRDENKELKQRVGQLEVAVDGALDLVNGIGL